MSKKKKMIYIASEYPKGVADPGVKKKVDTQVKTLKAQGIDIELKRYPLQKKIIRVIPFQTSSIDWSNVNISIDVGVVYIRYMWSDYQFIRFLKRIKQTNPNIKIIVEVPTYPYEGEKKHFIIVQRDLFYRKRLKKYVDKIVVLARKEPLFGVPTIEIYNGIDLKRVEKRWQPKPDGTIKMLCTANFRTWHGVDRLIQGMINYYVNGGEIQFELHLAGEGSSIEELKSMASNSLIKNKVKFYGYIDGEELNQLYNRCDMAIASLGCHRKVKNGISSELKTREYLAKGIPFIYSTPIDVLIGKEFAYAMKVEETDAPIDMVTVAEFYNDMLSKENIVEEMRKFAEENVAMDKAMMNVTLYVKDILL